MLPPAPATALYQATRAGALGALGEADRQQGEGRRGGDRGADPLQGAGAEQPGRRLGDAAEHRGEGEEGDAGDEDLAAAEDVTGAGAEQQQAAEGQRVGVLHPGEAGGREAEVLVDARQRRDHDRDVEDDHQVAAEDDREDEGGVGGGGFGGRGASWQCVSWRGEMSSRTSFSGAKGGAKVEGASG